MAAVSATKERYRELIDRSCSVATSFVNSYYQYLDNTRSSLKTVYKDTTTVAWNGQGMSGSEFRTFILELPASDHKVDAVDAQPILATIQADGNCAVLVVASGTVKYKPEAKSRRFVCNFVVTPTGPNGSLQVDSEDFRFV